MAKCVVFLLKRTEKHYICPSMKKVYLFNPENDMALASGSPYYMTPASAKKMAADLATLPAWYAEAGSEVWVANVRQVEWLKRGCRLSLGVEGITGIPSEGDEVIPWGWSPSLLHRLGSCCTGEVKMDTLRTLSNRRTAVDLLPKLRLEGTVGESSWLTSVEDVCRFSSRYEKILLKAPWSGSGKGIQPLCGQPNEPLTGWAKRIIASQGGVVGEPFYQKVKDFAMEFHVADGRVTFAGYSLFEADARGIYKENRLASDSAIERELSGYVSLSLLRELQEEWLQQLAGLLKDDYQGYLGVDMMVVHVADGFAVHPCVEVNLRMNMGVVSRLFFDRYVCTDVCGRYVIEYYAHSNEALLFHEEMKVKYPLKLENGRIRSGYLSLTPVFEDTNYQLYVLV